MHSLRALSVSALVVLLYALSPGRAAAQYAGADALSAPKRLPGRSLPQPSLERIVGNGLMVGGGALLLVGWGTNALGGFGAGVNCSFGLSFYGGGGSGCQHDAEWESFRTWSYVPVVGPYIQLATLPDEGRGGGWPGWLIASAVIQTAGVGLLLAGLVMRIGAAVDEEPEPAPVVLTPTVSADGAGLTVSGSF